MTNDNKTCEYNNTTSQSNSVFHSFSTEKYSLTEENLKIHTIVQRWNDLFQLRNSILKHITKNTYNEYSLEMIKMDVKIKNKYASMIDTIPHTAIAHKTKIQLCICLLFSNFKSRTLIICETKQDIELWKYQIYSILNHRVQPLQIDVSNEFNSPICITQYDTFKNTRVFEDIDEYYWNRIIIHHSMHTSKQLHPFNDSKINTLDYNVLFEI